MFSFHADAFKAEMELIYKWDLPPHSTKEERVLIIGPKKSVSDIMTKKSLI
jgi:hypothetical protein